MIPQMNQEMWERITRRINELLDLGLTPLDVLNILERAATSLQRERGKK